MYWQPKIKWSHFSKNIVGLHALSFAQFFSFQNICTISRLLSQELKYGEYSGEKWKKIVDKLYCGFYYEG